MGRQNDKILILIFARRDVMGVGRMDGQSGTNVHTKYHQVYYL